MEGGWCHAANMIPPRSLPLSRSPELSLANSFSPLSSARERWNEVLISRSNMQVIHTFQPRTTGIRWHLFLTVWFQIGGHCLIFVEGRILLVCMMSWINRGGRGSGELRANHLNIPTLCRLPARGPQLFSYSITRMKHKGHVRHRPYCDLSKLFERNTLKSIRSRAWPIWISFFNFFLGRLHYLAEQNSDHWLIDRFMNKITSFFHPLQQ